MNDNPGLAELYREHRRRLFGHAWQLTGDVPEAEDVVQETFLRALRSWRSYRERGRAGAWLLHILVNVVRERGRRATLYRWRIHPELTVRAGAGLDPGPSPEERLASAEAIRRALGALAGLTAELREVLVLRHFEERSTAEVAEILGLPDATVRSRLKRARDAVLRSCVRDDTCERNDTCGRDRDQEGQDL
jgi:RNA polymerase sigma-70 factor, ECF subfamily